MRSLRHRERDCLLYVMGNVSLKLGTGALREKKRRKLTKCMEKYLHKTHTYGSPSEYQNSWTSAGQSLQKILGIKMQLKMCKVTISFFLVIFSSGLSESESEVRKK